MSDNKDILQVFGEELVVISTLHEMSMSMLKLAATFEMHMRQRRIVLEATLAEHKAAALLKQEAGDNGK